MLSSQLLSIHVSSHQSLTWNNAPLVRTLSQSSYATRPGRPLAPYKHTFAPLPKCYQTNDFGSGHALFIKCVQVAALGHVKSPGRGAYAHAAKNIFFFFFFFFFFFLQSSVLLCVLSEGWLLSNASVSDLSLLGGLHWQSIRQSVCQSEFSIGTVISGSPSSTEGQILQACMTDRRVTHGDV